jgi:hypothetical protein
MDALLENRDLADRDERRVLELEETMDFFNGIWKCNSRSRRKAPRSSLVVEL